MNNVFKVANKVEFSYADKTPKRLVEQSHYQILIDLAEKKFFPEIFIDLLDGLKNQEDRDELSKRFLKIYLYASTIIKNPQKLYKWLLKGNLPQSISQGYDSMTLLTQYAKRANKLNKNKEKEIDRISKTRDKLSSKSSKKLEDSLIKSQEKLTTFDNQFETQKQIIESIILEIETALASGRKL